MRIGIDYTAAVRQGAGIGRYCRELIQALLKLDATNEYALFVAGRLTPTQQGVLREQVGYHENVQVRTVPLSDRWLNRLWHRLNLPIPIEWATGPLDLFHSPDFSLPPLRQAKSLLQIHDLSFLRVPQYADPKLQRYLETTVPRSVARADLILADSQHTKEDIISLLQVPSERIMVIWGGVEHRFRPITDGSRLHEVQRKYGLPDHFLLGLGTLEPRKNFEGLINAYGILHSTYRHPHHLVIGGGKGWLFDSIFERVKALGLEEQVHFLGFVADDDLPALYSLAEVFAFPSFYEGFGLPILESMACGTPVISSNASSLPEVVGKAGLLINPGDTEGLAAEIHKLLSQAALCQELIERGREQAKRFTWERAARQLLLAYRHV